MSQPEKDPNVIVLRGRASYLTINEKQRQDEEQKRKKNPKPGEENKENKETGYSWSLIMDKERNAADIENLHDLLVRVASEHPAWKGKVVMVKGNPKPLVSQSNPKAEKVVLLGTCLKDGADKADKDGYGDHVMFMSCNRKAKDGPPRVLDKNKQDIRPEESHYPYSGCDAITSVRVWIQDNDYGKRINAEGRIIIFDKHNDPFGKGTVDPDTDLAGVDLDDESETAAPATKPAAKKPAADLSIDDM
jgi:hypothetical protein